MARTPDKRGEKPGGFRGLPPLEEPVVERGHRVVLVACSETGRASWADLAPLGRYGGGYWWVKNLPAVPDFKAIRGERRKSSGGAAGSGSGEATLEDGSLYWGGYNCGVCGCDSCPVPGHEESIFWQCGDCRTLYCSGGFEPTGDDAWYLTCPGCSRLSVLRAYEETGTIGEYDSSRGRSAGGGGLTGDGPADSRQLGGGTDDSRRTPDKRR